MEERKIKFRAIRTDSMERFNKLMFVEGYLVKTPITAEFNANNGQFFDSASAENPNWGGRLCIVTEHGVAHEIDKKTVGQFTGLKDKNQKEIWDGDIVDGMARRYFIKNSDRGLYEFWESETEQGYHYGIWNVHKELEVIGNIHQNPELINKPLNK